MANRIDKIKEALNKPKEINEILDEQIETALREHNRSNQDLFLSAISAGLDIGFSVFLMAVIFSLFNGVIHPSMLHVLIALAYPLGFIFVVIGRSELFTEHTTLAVIPVLNRNATIKSLLAWNSHIKLFHKIIKCSTTKPGKGFYMPDNLIFKK